MRYGIIADDLTGACDAVAPFATAGKRTFVQLEPESAVDGAPEVVACSTDSRGVSPDEATEKTRRWARQLVHDGYRPAYKKIDSTLLGNIAAETMAVLDVTGASVAVFAPAFPRMGRTIIDGELRLYGSAACPAVNLPALLHCGTGLNCHTISRRALRAGPTLWAQLLVGDPSGERRIVVVDGQTDEDLDFVAEALAQLDDEVLPVGSGGLAARLALRLPAATPNPDDSLPLGPWLQYHQQEAAGPAIIAVGSQNPRTLKQLEWLRRSEVVISLDLVPGVEDQIQSHLCRHRPIVVTIDWKRLDRGLLQALFEHWAQLKPAGVVATGGDTARLVCHACRCPGIELVGELSPGIPVGRFVGGLLDGVPLVTKAGGFGDDQALLSAVRQLTPNVGRNTLEPSP